ncbi:TetR/AcrR family transcriptional regulator [Nesterenkonia halotolerans]|uniref:AcrR family transcriptional regulator n=1 Tax=Nesterenkonia halotolerans TaxID=225325 RepID=A0ABR9J9L6_9MICC|nr:TetR family transcriptional regulator [Nesterenkonia halotolerans]MBE1515590.1 AcrR family transcriptional regulator [Nesterenkonia halotolerans]
MDESIGIRERTRGAMRGELADVALRLFEERGYDETPVDEISTAAGISPRTFYRYFGTKEDVLFADLPPTSVDLSELLTEHLSKLSPWEALHQTLRNVSERMQTQRGRWSRLLRVVNTSDSLRAGHLEQHMNLAQTLIPVIAPQLEGPASSSALRARVLVHTALTCFDTAFSHWAEHESDIEILDAVDIAFATFSNATPETR